MGCGICFKQFLNIFIFTLLILASDQFWVSTSFGHIYFKMVFAKRSTIWSSWGGRWGWDIFERKTSWHWDMQEKKYWLKRGFKKIILPQKLVKQINLALPQKFNKNVTCRCFHLNWIKALWFIVTHLEMPVHSGLNTQHTSWKTITFYF